MGQRTGSRWLVWVRGVLAVVVGYAGYATGLMVLVMAWFIRGEGVQGVAAHAANAGALIALGLLLAEGVGRLAGGGARVVVLVLVGLIVAVSVLNLYLGVSIEPRWYTVESLVLISASLLFRRSRLAPVREGSG